MSSKPYESAHDALRAVLCGPDGQPAVYKTPEDRATIHRALAWVGEMERELRKRQGVSPAIDEPTPLTLTGVARVCHEVNRAYCQAIGDMSQPAWEDAPDWQKESAINGVAFHISNPDAGPEASHDSWMRQKVADGWVYGDMKDPDRKQHPCMVPFDQLPQEQQAKDFIFRAVVRALVSTILPVVK